MYKKTRLDAHDLMKIRESLVLKGVVSKRINPKSIPLDDLFGVINKESYVWNEGVFTN